MRADVAIFVGCDPGLTGAISIIDQNGRPIAVYDIATRSREISETVIKKEFHAVANSVIIEDRLIPYKNDRWIGWVEMPFSIPGGNMMGTNSLYQTYGGILAVFDLLGIDTHTIQASKWKKQMGVNKHKDYSLEVARKLWPTVELGAKKHHNRAESLLIAEYGRLIWCKERQYA